MNIADLLLRPAAFFPGHLEGDKPDLKMPLAIVVLSGIVGAVCRVYVLGDDGNDAVRYGRTGFDHRWRRCCLCVHWCDYLLDHRCRGLPWHLRTAGGRKGGDFQRTLAVVGYGSLPMVFGSIISGIIVYVSLSGADIRPISDPMQASAVVTELTSTPSMMMATVISILFVLWSANIWVFGMQEARNLSGKDALITVGIPVVIYCLILSLTYIG